MVPLHFPTELPHVMVATQGHVLVRAAHVDLLQDRGRPRRINRLRSILAIHTERLEFPYGVGVRHELQNLTERLSIGIPVQAHNDHMLPHNVYSTQDELLEVSEELRLFHDDMAGLEKLPRLHDRHEGVLGEGGIGVAVVAHNGVVLVPGIKTACNTKSLDADDGVAPKSGDNGRGLPREHGADVEF